MFSCSVNPSSLIDNIQSDVVIVGRTRTLNRRPCVHSAFECRRFWTSLSFWPYLAIIKKRLKWDVQTMWAYDVDIWPWRSPRLSLRHIFVWLEYCCLIISQCVHFCCWMLLTKTCSMEWESSWPWFCVNWCIFHQKRLWHFCRQWFLTSNLLCLLLFTWVTSNEGLDIELLRGRVTGGETCAFECSRFWTCRSSCYH